MKRHISLLLVIAMTLSILQPFAANNQAYAAQIFSDLPETHWAAESVNTLVSQNIISGYPDGTFRPDNPIKVEEFVTLTVRALGYDNLTAEPGERWSDPYHQKAKELGLYDDSVNNINLDIYFYNKFSVYISRQEVTFIINQAAEIVENGDINYEASQEFIEAYIADFDDIGRDFKEAVMNSYGLGLIAGFPDQTFKPTDNLTRAQAAVVIYRLLYEEQRLPLTPVNKTTSTTSKAWYPDEYGASTDGIIHWKSINYLTKNEAIAVYAGIEDSELVAELILAKDVIANGTSNTIIYFSGIALRDWALRHGFVKLAEFATGLGGALFLGQMVSIITEMQQTVDKIEFHNAIVNTNDGYFVKVAKFYTINWIPIPGGTMPIPVHGHYYDPHNSNLLEGAYNINGTFSDELDFEAP